MMVELLTSTAITMVIMGGILTLMSPVRGIFQAQPEVSDMQQQLRVGADALAKDLMMAGAGTYAGSPGGALNSVFAPVLPYRIGDYWALIHRPVSTYLGAHIWISFSPDLRHWGSHKMILQARRGAWWDANKIGLSPPPRPNMRTLPRITSSQTRPSMGA